MEDVALADSLAQQGFRIGLLNGHDEASVRMYQISACSQLTREIADMKLWSLVVTGDRSTRPSSVQCSTAITPILPNAK
jgi:hypothetical protein